MPRMQVLQEREDESLRERSAFAVFLSRKYTHRFDLVYTVRATQGKGLMPDGTTRFKCNGKDIFHFVRPAVLHICADSLSFLQMGTSTFSQYTVVADVSVVAINKKAPLDRACLLGCGITTAWGSVVKQPGISMFFFCLARQAARHSDEHLCAEGSSVAVFGCGCIGLGVIQTSSLVGASRIIAVDTNPNKEAWAKKMGATDYVNPMALDGKKIQDHLIEMTDGGLDFTFDCTGNVSLREKKGGDVLMVRAGSSDACGTGGVS